MSLSDCHTHSNFSHDGHDSMTVMAQAAYEKGLDYLCFTDHCDDCAFADFTPERLKQFFEGLGHDLAPYESQTELYDTFCQARDEYKGKVGLLLGIELSCMNHDKPTARRIMKTWPFDYILASNHNLRGRDDYFQLDYGDGSSFPALAADYLDENIEMVEMGGFDGLAHLGYFLRYMARAGVPINSGFMIHRDRLEKLFTLMIEKGIALEVNTSGLFYGYDDFIPNKDVMKLYRSLGGELVTLGSDGHMASRIGAGMKSAHEMLASLGFEYYTVFVDRKPLMLPL